MLISKFIENPPQETQSFTIITTLVRQNVNMPHLER